MPRQPTFDEIHLSNITACLTLALPLLDDLNDAFGPPFVPLISTAIQALIDAVQNVKRNKSECAQLMENIHHLTYAIVNLHMKSETVGSLPPSMLANIGKFIETLHKIYTFIEAQQQGNKIKHFLRNNDMNKLLQDCHTGLKQAQEAFSIHTQTQTLNELSEFKKTVDFMHKELIGLIEELSDTTSVLESSSMELNHILKLISELSPRIAVLGGGGMGKTSLARTVLHHPDTCSKFEHRFFVSAETATTCVELAALVGLHVGLNPGQDLTKPVIQYFSQKELCLLVLDNLETVWEPINSRAEVEEFLSLLSGLEHLALMITMRGAERPSKVQWSHPFLLPLQPLSNDAARQTFIDITDNSNTIEEMDQILGFTDNMPLAVDLIAHLADYEGFSNVLSQWKTEKTSLLSFGFDRQSSLDVSISLSLSSPRITSGSKELLSLLSILPNGLSEAELVQGNLGIPNILHCKATLQATSLAYWDSNRRLVLLMPIREYIQQILPPTLARIQHIHKYFCDVLELFEKYRGEQMKAVVNQIALNQANLQEILQRGLRLHAPTHADTIQCVLSLNRFYTATGRGHFPLLDDIPSVLSSSGHHRLETMFVIERLQTGTGVSQDMIERAILYIDHANDPILGSKFYQRAAHYFYYQKVEEQLATQFYEKALEMSELSGDSTQQCNVLIQLSSSRLEAGNYDVANDYATEAQRLSKLSANLYAEARAICFGAACSKHWGDYKKSAAQLYRASELLHICGMSGGILHHIITGSQAEIHLQKSEYTEARNIFCHIAETTSAKENSYSYAHALLKIGLIDTLIGGAEEDIHHNLNTAQDILQKSKYGSSLMHTIVLAFLEFREGRFDVAMVKFQEGLHSSWGKDIGAKSLCLEQLANIKAWPASKQQDKWSIIYLVFAHKLKAKLDLHKALLFLGDVFSTNQDETTATNLYAVALAGFTQMDVHHSRAQCLLCLGDLANKHGYASEAINFWKAAQPLFEQSLQAKDVAKIDSKLRTFENAHKEALGKLETLHAPIELLTETWEIEAKDSVEEDAEAEKHAVPISA
ncbi:hypothetical protein K438DRAFT_2096588 [Mycena galopus ATCC 62051]|nr:hypothetical protein K438DRAFT_2096588 [Mycena galopus ATCC 62051]